MTDKDNIIQLPTVRTDRVSRLASAISKVMELSDLDNPEDHLTALMLVQTAVQQAIARKEGPEGLRRCLVLASERSRHYLIRWNYKADK